MPKAAEVYLEGKDEFENIQTTEVDKNIRGGEIRGHALGLTEDSDEGTRIGAPGRSEVKWIYYIPPGEEEKYFFIKANGMDDKDFKKWQSFIGKKFANNNLKFYYFA